MLQDKYLKVTRDMCFQYEQSMGAYVQTVEMHNSKSVFETEVDISGLQDPSSISQFMVHRNTHRSIGSQLDD